MIGLVLLLSLAQPIPKDIPEPPSDCKSMCEMVVKQCKDGCLKQGGKKAASMCQSSCADVGRTCNKECKEGDTE